MINYIEIKAPAKINIGLNIVEKRNDGFHNLETLFYPINDLFDKITIKKSEKFEFKCSNNDISKENIIIDTIKILEEIFNKKFNVSIILDKYIPMGAGLGGGSSDAAAVLLAMNDMFNLKLSWNRLKEIALQIGSDVPFFLRSIPAIGRSRGEVLNYVDLEIKKTIVLVNPGIHISTKEAYSSITPKKNKLKYENLISKFDSNVDYLRENLINDFEDFVFKNFPQVENIKENMLNSNAEISLMSGSGSTVFGIFRTKKDAENYLKSVNKQYYSFLSYESY